MQASSCTGCPIERPTLELIQSSWLRVLRGLLISALVACAAFAAGVIWYHAPTSKLIDGTLALAWFAFSLVCIAAYVRRKDWRALASFAAPFATILILFILIKPSNDRVWSPEMARLLTYKRDGDALTIENVRNFNWTGPKTADERWETRHYSLAEIKSVDVLSLYWKGPRIAHTYFSFVWQSGEALSLSVEIRKETDESYSPVAGFFKAYELSILAGDERDFYGWRVYFPKEDIQLFHTRATPGEAGKLLIALLEAANEHAAKPEFYNTLTENCTTEVWMFTHAMGLGAPTDWRLFASGYLPEFLYDLKLLDSSRRIENLREAGHIMPRVRAALDQDLTGAAFSNAIREGIPQF